MVVYSEVDRFYGDWYDLRETTREIFAMMPDTFVNFYYCDALRAFGESVRKGAKNIVRVPVLIVSRSANPICDRKASSGLDCFRVYGAEAHFCLWGYKLVPYSSQSALIKACGGNYPRYRFERVGLGDSAFVQKYKSVYYLSGTSSKFEKGFFLLIFDRLSDAVKVLRRTLEVFRKVFDLLGADFCFYQTKSVYSLIEYMYNPNALFAKGSLGWKWCHAFLDCLIKGVVDASEVSSGFLVGERAEIVRWE